MSSFLETISAAYLTGDLTDPIILRQAMMFENHSNCPNEVKNALEKLTEWPKLDPKLPAPGWNTTKVPFSESVPAGNLWMPSTTLHRIVKSEFILKHVSITINKYIN